VTALDLSCDDAEWEAGSLKSIEGLEGMTNLMRLSLKNRWTIADLRPLHGLRKLAFLDLYGCSSIEWSSLAGLTQVKELNIGGGCVEKYEQKSFLEDVKFLSGLENLNRLKFPESNILDNLNFLEQMHGLHHLELYAGSSLADITPLGKLTELESLKLNFSSDSPCQDLKPLASLCKLKELIIRPSSAVMDISPIAKLTQLEILDLCDSFFLKKLNLSSDLLLLKQLSERSSKDKRANGFYWYF
jgi:hypothetical protein